MYTSILVLFAVLLMTGAFDFICCEIYNSFIDVYNSYWDRVENTYKDLSISSVKAIGVAEVVSDLYDKGWDFDDEAGDDFWYEHSRLFVMADKVPSLWRVKIYALGIGGYADTYKKCSNKYRQFAFDKYIKPICDQSKRANNSTKKILNRYISICNELEKMYK